MLREIQGLFSRRELISKQMVSTTTINNAKKLFRRVISVFAISATLTILSSEGAQSQPSTAFCAKRISDLNSSDRIKLNKLKSEAKKSTSTIIWNTSIIPYYVDSRIKADANLIKNFNEARKEIYEYTGLKMVGCNSEISKEVGVPAFIYVGTFNDFCNVDISGAAACSSGIGMKSKNTPNGLPSIEKIPSPEDAKLAKIGAAIGLKSSNNVYVIVHEIMHRLGFRHQHQNPAAEGYVKISSGLTKTLAYNCNMLKMGDAYWIPQYDPASVMHYKLESCDLIDLNCVDGKTISNRTELKSCQVDTILNSDKICIYSSSTSAGEKCFRRPVSKFKNADSKYVGYGNHDFGQQRCLSALDQALVIAAYEEVLTDRYQIGSLISRGICEGE